MATASHVLIYSRDAEADRAIIGEMLGMPSGDAGGGLVESGAARIAFHPADPNGVHELCVMSQDLPASMPEESD